MIAVCFVILPSYILHYYINIDINTIYAATVVPSLLISIRAAGWKIERRVLVVIVSLNIFGIIGSLFSGALSQILMTLSLTINLIVASCGRQTFSNPRMLRALNIFAITLVAGAAFAYVYAFAGGQPIAEIRLFSRPTYLYLTTFTNAIRGDLIRAAGIFDEPGALAMYITVIVALNEIYKENKKLSGYLLFGGLVTGSFALLFIVIAYLFVKLKKANLIYLVLTLSLIGVLVNSDSRFQQLAEDFFLTRVEVVDGRLSGDNRTHQVEEFLNLVNWDITLKGTKASDQTYPEHDGSSNPFSIYEGYGIFVWLPYLFLQLWLAYCAIFYRTELRFPAVAIFLTLLQRPYLYSMYWGMMISVVVVSIYIVQREKTNPKPAGGR